jgi:hypothetical protein
VRVAPLLLIGSAIALAAAPARAQSGFGAEAINPTSLNPSQPAVVESHAVAWPLMLDIHALLGFEPHSERGNPIAFGAGAELLWRARIGGFAELLSSGGTGLIAPTVNGVMEPGFADRISIPFGMAARPLARWFVDRTDWGARLATGIGVQLGVTVEHLRTSDDSTTTAGLHAALAIDVPIWGGPKQSGIALRLYARLMITPTVNLDNRAVFEPATSGQLFAGLVYIP